MGLKAATNTPEKSGDVGSPNAILRDAVDGTVIVHTGRRIPGVRIMDLGGTSSTTEFTDEVIRRVKSKLEVWQALGD